MITQLIEGPRKRGELVVFHAPNSRSVGTLTLLDELGASYELRAIDLRADEQREPAYTGVNPLGKVPALLHDGVLVTEQVAVTIYLADRFADAGLAPALDDPERGAYLRWIAFQGSSFEPAMVDKAMKRTPAPRGVATYGEVEQVLSTLLGALERGPYLLGERFTAADVLWGISLGWLVSFGLVPKEPAVVAYVERIKSRPSVARVADLDRTLVARFDAAKETAG
ncbi:glutathione S-transferase family protein [Chondromyces crocatus]|uniref:Glutathione S-transferase n=1 Tax=Chondromyces crocatus TaxID=52 RepID=A0A0K1EN34_CHOCO|nr:glutathione S-transferase family protein [Chondromyces crocatus]AKT42246.1 glutathione S-transferase [Chondromyces crocatus]